MAILRAKSLGLMEKERDTNLTFTAFVTEIATTYCGHRTSPQIKAQKNTQTFTFMRSIT
jgi:hypothetical protein